MYAVIRTGGKQYRAAIGETIQVEKMEGSVGQTLQLDEVLLLAQGEAVTVGRPLVAGAKITAEIVAQGRTPKVVIYKFRRRKKYRRKTGHRQMFTSLKITGIASPAAEA
jgi:large subunit ribosomal protein L21